MAVKRAFRPTDLDGREQLESRAALSHVGVTHVFAQAFNNRGPQRAQAQRIPRRHGRPRFQGAGTNTGQRANTPVVVVPIKNRPASPPPAASPPVQAPDNATPADGIPAVSGVMSTKEQAIVDLVNQQRTQAGLAPLQFSSKLVEAAQIHSTNMARLGRMEHTLTGSVLPGLQDRAQHVGYNFSYLGENIAFNYPDGNSVMTAWMNSPGHRANILNPNFTEIGVGISNDSQGQPYYTQEFGKPT